MNTCNGYGTGRTRTVVFCLCGRALSVAYVDYLADRVFRCGRCLQRLRPKSRLTREVYGANAGAPQGINEDRNGTH